MKHFFLTCIALLLLTLISIEALAQQDEKQPATNFIPFLQEQLVYNWNAFDGKSWIGGFIPKNEDTIYLIADKDNSICAKKTLVYFWPITATYMAGWKTLNEDVEGVLEILKDGKILKKLQKEDTVLHYPEVYWSEKILFYKGKEAQKQYQIYKAVEEKYYETLNEYYAARTEHQEKMNQFFEEAKKKRESGEEGAFNLEIPKEPEPPKGPDFYTTNPQKNYIINLPVGVYQIRLRAEDKTIVEGSEKNLLIFTTRRKEGVGYEIIPGNRWTQKEGCNDPSSAIYAAGRNVLYFRPYQQDEYNEFYHNKLLNPQSTGIKENWKWVHSTPIEEVTLLFQGPNELSERIEKKPYKVQQIPGPELGYNIVEFSEDKFPGEKPTFEGYQLILSENLPKKRYNISLERKDGDTIISGSERKIKLVRKENTNLLYSLSLLPLIVGGIVFSLRRRKVKK